MIYLADSAIHLSNNWDQVWKRVCENDIFCSEKESGFREQGGTPPSRIPKSTPREKDQHKLHKVKMQRTNEIFQNQ